MTAPLHAGRRAGLLRAAEFLAPAKAAIAAILALVALGLGREALQAFSNILDEPTSALDAETEHLVQQALDRVARGRTSLVIAHPQSTVVDADRIVVLEEGRIVEEGTHQGLLALGGYYRTLVEKQARGLLPMAA